MSPLAKPRQVAKAVVRLVFYFKTTILVIEDLFDS
jgi:hypothetical protein